MRNREDENSKLELEEIEQKLDEKCAEANYNKIKDEISKIKVDEGGIHSGNLWKLKKKLSPRCRDPPTAMLDPSGNLLTSQNAIDDLALKTFKDRLKNREIIDNLINLKEQKEELCRQRLKSASKNKTPPWMLF